MFWALIVVGLLVLAIPVAILFISEEAAEKTKAKLEIIINKINPFVENEDVEKLDSINEAVDTAISGKKEVRTSSNTATLATYQRKVQVLESNVAQLVTDFSDLSDFSSHDQVTKYVNSNVTKLLVKSGIKEWTPKNGVKFDAAIMVKAGGDGDTVQEVLEPGFRTKEDVIVKARVILN